MKQQIKAILDDDRGVSPVIGVILMVAITVILAAVIGTFVLGLGDSLQQAPQAQLNVDAGNSSSFNVSHDGGDSIPASELTLSLDGDTYDFTIGEDISSGDDFGVGSTITFSDVNSFSSGTPVNDAAGGEIRVRIIHDPSESIILDQTVDIPSSP